MKKIISALALCLIAATALATPQTNNSAQPSNNSAQQANNDKNSALYHGYEGKKFIADSSSSTRAYVTRENAEKFRPLRIKLFIPGLFIGRIGGTIDYKISNALAIGGIYRSWTNTGTSTNFFTGETTKYDDFYNTYGLDMQYAVNGNLNARGWILNPRLTRVDYRFHDGFGDGGDDKDNVTQHSTNAGIYLMYQWAWPTGIYMQLGVGADYVSNPNSNLLSLTNSHFGGDWDFTLGFQF